MQKIDHASRMDTELLKKRVQQWLKYIILLLLSVTTIIPFIWMLSSSFKPETELFSIPIQWIPKTLYLDNYKEVFTEIPFLRFYLNTLKLAVCVTTLQVISSSMMGFSLAKLHYPGRQGILILYLSTMMIPFQVIMIPQFLLINRLGLIDTHFAIIALQAFTPFGVFLMRQFLANVPNEIIEAARIDGAGYVQTYIRIVMPLAKPAISSLAIITFIFSMNDFLAPFIYLNSENLKTITLGLRSLTTEYVSKYAMQMAGSTCALIPILTIYAVGQKQILKGIAFGGGGAVKG